MYIWKIKHAYKQLTRKQNSKKFCCSNTIVISSECCAIRFKYELFTILNTEPIKNKHILRLYTFTNFFPIHPSLLPTATKRHQKNTPNHACGPWVRNVFTIYSNSNRLHTMVLEPPYDPLSIMMNGVRGLGMRNEIQPSQTLIVNVTPL